MRTQWAWPAMGCGVIAAAVAVCVVLLMQACSGPPGAREAVFVVDVRNPATMEHEEFLSLSEPAQRCGRWQSQDVYTGAWVDVPWVNEETKPGEAMVPWGWWGDEGESDAG